MSSLHLVPHDLRELYEVHEWRNATAVLAGAYQAQWEDIQAVLRGFRFLQSEVGVGGGGKSKVSGKLDSHFYRLGWVEKKFSTQIVVDGNAYDSPTHKVDCLKEGVALEIEWNNKDPFYDRDLNNFRLLFELRAIGVGVMVTRCDELQAIFNSLGKKVGQKYGPTTTHMGRLLPRIDGGGGGGCPILVFGISAKLYGADGAPVEVAEGEVTPGEEIEDDEL